MSERTDQAALFDWAGYNLVRYPELSLLFAIPNGQMRRGGPMEPGMKKGVPDIMLPVARGKYHGMFLELKVNDNVLSDAQRQWLEQLAKQGFYTCCCWGWEEARDEIVRYLEMK